MSSDTTEPSASDASGASKRGVDSAQADAFRERIVQASVELIREQGLSALSMREVARRAGVSHQAPYYYFADREAIIGAIAEQGFRAMREYVERSAPAPDAAPHEAILAAGRAYLEFAFERPAHFRVMFRPELVTHERHPKVLGEGIDACDTFFRIVKNAAAAGLPVAPGADAFFLLCWSVVHGLACLVLDGPLDAVMPQVERQTQLRDVLAGFSRLMEASMAQAAQGKADPLGQARAGKASKPSPGSAEKTPSQPADRATPRRKKAAEKRR